MAERGRPRGFVMDDSHRTKIANSQILKRLIEHAEGRIEMTSTQVQTGLGLLKKVMPDLQAVQIQGNGENGEITVVNRIERLIVKADNGHASD